MLGLPNEHLGAANLSAVCGAGAVLGTKNQMPTASESMQGNKK